MRAARWQAWALGLALTISGGGLRLWHLTTHPTWWDEHASLFSAAGQVASQGSAFEGRVSSAVSPQPTISPAQEGAFVSAEKVWQLFRAGNVPAATLFWDRGNGLAFNFLLHFWVKAFGAGDAALRALPWLLGTLCIPLAFVVALRAGGGLAGAGYSAALVAANALLVEYSREARPYCLAMFLALAATALLLLFAGSAARWWHLVLYGVCMVALAFTHYLAAPVVFGAHGLAALFFPARLRVVGAVAAASLATGLALAAWMAWGGGLGMASMAEHSGLWLQHARNGILWYLRPFHWPDAIRLTIERPLQFIWPGILFWPREHPMGAALVGMWACAVMCGLWHWWRGAPRERTAPAVLFLGASAGAALSLVLSWKSGHTLPFINRYLITSIPFQCLLLGMAFSGSVGALANLRGRMFGAVALVVMTVAGLGMLRANLHAALNPKRKETFSFDLAVRGLPPGAVVRSDSLDSALVFALKAGPARSIEIEIVPSLKNKIEITSP